MVRQHHARTPRGSQPMLTVMLGAAVIAFSPHYGWAAGEAVPPGDDEKMAAGVNQLATEPIRVTEVKWVGFEAPDGKTNYEEGGHPDEMGGGDRIFVGRNQPPGRNGDASHLRILVEATLSAPPAQGATLTVYFRVFDPDHYSSDTDFDPNGATDPRDNVEAGGQVLSDTGAHLELLDEYGCFDSPGDAVTITGDGSTETVRIGLRFDSRQPCNNYKVAAKCSKRYLDHVEFDADGFTLKCDDGNGPEAPQTELLTVWRKLHVERDSMGSPVYTQGDAKSRIATGGIQTDYINGPYFLTDSSVSIHREGCSSQFHGGRIQLLRQDGSKIGQPMTVESNGTGTIVIIQLDQSVPTDAYRFENLDDDDLRGASTVTAHHMEIDISLWAAAYKPACVEVVTDKTDLSPNDNSNVNSNNVAFETNIGTTSGIDDPATPEDESTQEAEQMLRITNANRQSVCEYSFWCVYQCGAFQGRTWQDNDPHFEADPVTGEHQPCYGTSYRASDPKNAGTFVYAEVCRDHKLSHPEEVKISFANFKAAVSLHESAHQFGLEDTSQTSQDGKIMNAGEILAADSDEKVKGLTFSAKGLRKIMIKGRPGKS